MRIGDTVTKEEFIKFAPLGMELTLRENGAVLKFTSNFTPSSSNFGTMPGFVFCYQGTEELITGAWDCFHNSPQSLTISKLPKLKILKRKHLCTQS